MRSASGWNDREGYARFLTLQYCARKPVETWLTDHAPASLKPPVQCPLIACDLARMGHPVPLAGDQFVLSEPHPARTLGAAWVLAGSVLGNRSILKQLSCGPSADWPHEFLADPAMLQFWSALKKQIERPASLEEVASATAGASAVFAHFLTHTEIPTLSAGALREAPQTCPMRSP